MSNNEHNQLVKTGLSWTGVRSVGGYGNSGYAWSPVPKRNSYPNLPKDPFLLARPGVKGFDRFGLDCLADMQADGALKGDPDQMGESFASYCERIDNYNSRCRIDYEELRMLAVLLVPLMMWFGLFFLKDINFISSGLFLVLLPIPLFVGWKLHKSLEYDLYDSLHPHTVYLTTFLTRNGLSVEDVKKNPELITEGIRISSKIQELVKYQIQAKMINYHSFLTNRLPSPVRFQIPVFKGTINNLNLSQWYRDYRSIDAAKARGHYFERAAPLVFATGAGYAVHSAIPDTSYATEIPAYEPPSIPEIHIPYANGLDDIGLPQFNTNGNLMIENTGIDYQGNVYGSPHEY
jgi:hypothetical protein